jgi:hypothetical protein
MRTLNAKEISMKKETVKYTKPVIVAQNNKNGSFAAGCPPKDRGIIFKTCVECERTE